MLNQSLSLSLSVAKEFVKARVSYVFNGKQATPDQWEISTWSKKVVRSSIMKHGNVSDKANLPEATCYNQPRQQHHHRHRPLADG
jgi:hypothetical protein